MKNTIQNNKGYSLVELLVVMAIMVVLAGLMTISLNTLTGRQAQQGATELKSKLENVRAQTMGKKSVTSVLKKDATSGRYVLTVTTVTTDTAGTDNTTTADYMLDGKNYTIYYSTDSTATATWSSSLPTADGGVSISFNRASGALEYLAGGTSYVYHIYFVRNNTVYGTIDFYPETGKMELN